MTISKHKCIQCGETVGFQKSPRAKINICDECAEFYEADTPDIRHKGIQDTIGDTHIIKDRAAKDKYEKANKDENTKETLW